MSNIGLYANYSLLCNTTSEINTFIKLNDNYIYISKQ